MISGAEQEYWVLLLIGIAVAMFTWRGLRGRWGLAIALLVLPVGPAQGQWGTGSSAGDQLQAMVLPDGTGDWLRNPAQGNYYGPARGYNTAFHGQWTIPLAEFVNTDGSVYYLGVRTLYGNDGTDFNDPKRCSLYLTVISGEPFCYISTDGGAWKRIYEGVSGSTALNTTWRFIRDAEDPADLWISELQTSSYYASQTYIDIVADHLRGSAATQPSTQPTTQPYSSGPNIAIEPVDGSMPWIQQAADMIGDEEGFIPEVASSVGGLPNAMGTGYGELVTFFTAKFTSGTESTDPAEDARAAIVELTSGWDTWYQPGGSPLRSEIQTVWSSVVTSMATGVLPTIVNSIAQAQAWFPYLFAFIKLFVTFVLVWTAAIDVAEILSRSFGYQVDLSFLRLFNWLALIPSGVESDHEDEPDEEPEEA